MDDKRVTSSHGLARRRLMKALAASGGVFAAAAIVPTRWIRPIIETISVPLHAQGSPGEFLGSFTSTSQPNFSLLDRFIQPLHAAVRSVNVGNAHFDLAWDVFETSYAVCGNGEVTNGGSTSFTVNGGGGRTGTSLENFSQSIPGGTLSLSNQMLLSETQLFFVANYGINASKGIALPGGACNTTSTLTLSSPYPDDKPA